MATVAAYMWYYREKISSWFQEKYWDFKAGRGLCRGQEVQEPHPYESEFPKDVEGGEIPDEKLPTSHSYPPSQTFPSMK